jgi:hypothetical protein
MNQSWLVHIGMPKCGSTSLQHMFAESKDLFYEVEDFSLNNISQEPIANSLKNHPNPYYDLVNPKANGDNLLQKYASLAASAKKELSIISCENLIGLSEDEISSFRSTLTSLEISPSILMVVRPPFEYLVSSWKQAVTFGLLMPLEKYFETMDIDFQRIYSKWAKEFHSVDLLELRKGKDFKQVAKNYFLDQHGIILNNNISLSQENVAMFRLLACVTFIGLAKSHDIVFEATSIDLSWDPQNNHLPPFNLQSHKERVSILNNLESDILNNLSIHEIAHEEHEILEHIRQSFASKAFPPPIQQEYFWSAPIN